MFSNHHQVEDSLMRSDVRAADSARIYYVIVIRPAGLLTLRLDKARQAALVFTSQARAQHYLSEVQDIGLEGEVGMVTFSADQWGAFVQSWLSAGLTDFVVDKCPYCETFAGYKLSTDVKKDDWVRICAVVKATRMLQYDFNLNEATRRLAGGDVQTARRIGEHIVAYIDAERPEVHLLLARCGIEGKDEDLVRRKQAILEFFGPEWLARLQAIRN
jgi:hypothetical protein